ncbi:MAG: hypothetical protein SVZ03_03295 [Spirochaetota bacterium]|nr:hypothetical protein [Spirochaetota bacterium]
MACTGAGSANAGTPSKEPEDSGDPAGVITDIIQYLYKKEECRVC